MRSGYVEQNGLHSRVGRTQIVDGVHIAHVETLFRGRIHRAQGGLENGWVRLLMSDQARIGDREETVDDSAAFQHIGDLAVGVGDYRKRVASPQPQQTLSRARANIAPVRGNPRVIDQSIAQSIVMNAQSSSSKWE